MYQLPTVSRPWKGWTVSSRIHALMFTKINTERCSMSAHSLDVTRAMITRRRRSKEESSKLTSGSGTGKTKRARAKLSPHVREKGGTR